MKLELARSAGFCYGVKRAVEMAEQAARAGGAVLLGPVIHNDHVVAQLEEEGAVLVHTVEEVPPGAAVILRSHGEARRVHEALAEKGCRIVDTACPNVQRIHRLGAAAGHHRHAGSPGDRGHRRLVHPSGGAAGRGGPGRLALRGARTA